MTKPCGMPAVGAAARQALMLGIGGTLFCIAFIVVYAPSYQGFAFWDSLRDDDLPAGGLMLACLVLLMIFQRRLPAALARAPDFFGAHPWLVAVATTAVLMGLTVFAYRAHPLSMDEYAPWFQAKIFAAGHLAGRFPPDLIDHLISRPYQGHFLAANRVTGDVISTYWPGFALLLTPFMALGVPWALNPLVVGASLIVLWRLGCEILGNERGGGWVLLFALATPALTLNGISYYSMSAHLLCNMLFVLLLLQHGALRSYLAGVVGALALSLHNPFPHLVFALPWGLWLLGSRDRRRALVPLAAGYLTLAPLLVVGWVRFKAQFVAAAASPPKLLSGWADPPIVPPTLMENVFEIVTGLFTWPTDYLLLVRFGSLTKLWLWAAPMMLILAGIGLLKARKHPLWLFASSAAATLLAYYLIRFDQGMGWGYRYFHSALGVLPLLAAAGVQWLERDASEQAPAWSRLGVATCVSGLVLLTPYYVMTMERRVSMALSSMPPATEGRSLNVLHGRGYCATSRCDLLQNDPWLRGNVYLISKTPPLPPQALASHFPGAIPVAENQFGTTYRLPD